MKTRVLKARVTEQHITKMRDMCRKTGLKPSQVMRLLVEGAEVIPPSASVVLKSNSQSAQNVVGTSAMAVGL